MNNNSIIHGIFISIIPITTLHSSIFNIFDQILLTVKRTTTSHIWNLEQSIDGRNLSLQKMIWKSIYFCSNKTCNWSSDYLIKCSTHRRALLLTWVKNFVACTDCCCFVFIFCPRIMYLTWTLKSLSSSMMPVGFPYISTWYVVFDCLKAMTERKIFFIKKCLAELLQYVPLLPWYFSRLLYNTQYILTACKPT